MSKSISEILNDEGETLRLFGDDLNANLRVAMPGIIQSFDTNTQTVSVKLAIRERLKSSDLTREWVDIPILVDVPIVIPRSGGYAITMPISKGDECLVIFADMCIDAWFSNGGIQNQIERRRHDLSDAFAILGVWSQPNKISNYDTTSLKIINLSTGSGIIVNGNYIDLRANTIKYNGSDVSIGQPGPTGPQGPAGTAATINLGTVTTGNAGTGVEITNSGDSTNAVFNFTIPKGDKGDTGVQGIQGIQGVKGDTGATGPQGPQGPQGNTGATGSDGKSAYQVWLDSGNTGTVSDYLVSLKGAKGDTGAQGPPSYTWVKYATDSSGSNMSDLPDGMSYIGIAENKSTSTPSTTASDYKWALFVGPQGPAGTGSGDMLASVYDTDGNGIVDNAEAVNGKKYSDITNYVASRGENLVTNGTALLGDNTNFSSLTLDKSDAYGSGGSFKDSVYNTTRSNDELIPVNPDLTYKYSFYAKANPYVGAHYYGTVLCYDVDKLQISPTHTMYIPNTLTTLAQDLNPGDTKIYLTSAANWINSAGSATHQRSMIAWNYKNAGGYLYPPLTYSRNYYGYDLWSDGAVDYVNNCITLKVPWVGPTILSGTQVSNGSSGGTFKYCTNCYNTAIPSTWTQYSGTIGGIDAAGSNMSNKFHPATAYVKIGWLNNRDTTGSTVWYSNISFGLNVSNADTIDGIHLWKGTQAAYDSIPSKDSSTIYFASQADGISCLAYLGTLKIGGYF